MADRLGAAVTRAEEVATFYVMYHTRPVGRHVVEVCTNVSCSLGGGYDIFEDLKRKLGVENGETTGDGRITLRQVECLGSCGTAPLILVDEEIHESLTPQSVILQRIQDHKRIEEFLSKDLLQTFFALFTIFIYSAVLLFFDSTVFLIVLITTGLELIWIFRFLKKIRIKDQKSFALNSKDQDKIYELITGMQEIKLNNLEKTKTSQWQEIQSSIYLNNINKLKVNQQYESYMFIDYLRGIFVIFFSAIAVTNNTITIGTMLAIMFVLGGINGPIGKIINFVLRYQLVLSSFKS